MVGLASDRFLLRAISMCVDSPEVNWRAVITLAIWGTNRVIDQNCGQTWLQSFNEVGKFYSSGNQLPAMQIATWNDYEEGTTIEPGIDNCVFWFLPSLVPRSSGRLMEMKTRLTTTRFSSAPTARTYHH